MKILTRYVLREHVGPLLFSLAALTSLLLLNQIAKRFGDLVGKGLPWGVISEFFALSIPFIIAMTLPMAILVAVLYAFSRLAAENEVTALRASGVSLPQLVIPVLFGATGLAALMLAFNDQVLPRSNHLLRTLQADIARKKPTFALREQVINEVAQGRLFLKAGHVDEGSNRLREVTIYDLTDPQRRRTIYADSGNMSLTADERDLQMTLYTGYSQESPKNNPGELQRLYFSVDRVRVKGVANTLERTEDDQYKSDREMTVCEMQQASSSRASELRQAREEMAEAIVNTTRRLVRGTLPPIRTDDRKALAQRKEPLRGGPVISRVYCGYVLPLIGVRTAAAQQPASGGKAAERRLPPSSGVAPDQSLRVIEPGSTPAYPLERSVSGTVAQLDAISARVTETRQALNRYDVEIQKKFALSAACFVFVLLGAPIALRFPRGGVGLVIGVSLAVFALYYVGLIAGEALADRLILSPFVAMWFANILFTIVGLLFMARVQKTGATARGGDFSELLDSVRTWAARQVRRFGVPMDRRRRTA